MYTWSFTWLSLGWSLSYPLLFLFLFCRSTTIYHCLFVVLIGCWFSSLLMLHYIFNAIYSIEVVPYSIVCFLRCVYCFHHSSTFNRNILFNCCFLRLVYCYHHSTFNWIIVFFLLCYHLLLFITSSSILITILLFHYSFSIHL